MPFSNSSTVVAGDDALAADYNDLRKDAIRNAGDYASSTGSANAYLLSVDAQVDSYVEGDVHKFKANFNNTAAATLNVNSLGAKTIKTVTGQDLEADTIRNGQIVVVVYDGTDFLLVTSAVILGAKGSLEVASADGATKELTVGADGTALVADAGEDTGMKWLAPQFRIDSFTRDLTAVAGAVAITGVGFEPTYIEFSWGNGSTAAGTFTHGHGAWDGARNMSAYVAEEQGVGGNAVTDTSFCIHLDSDFTVNTFQEATVTATGSDGFTLTWAKTGSPTGTVTLFYRAFRFK